MANPSTAKIVAIIIASIAVTITFTTIAALTASQNVDLNGTINTINVEVYHDEMCTQPCSNINVGTLNPGSTFTKTIYIKNTGTLPETLTMTTNNWNPTTAGNYLDLSWNRQNYILNSGATCEATLTLTVATNTDSLTTFGFSATITGTT